MGLRRGMGQGVRPATSHWGDDMCDELTNKDAEEYLRRSRLTRRDFGKLGTTAALALLLPRAADALDVVEEEVLVQTPDGQADCHFVHPAEGRHAGVIIWPDIVGIRPAFRAMGKRLAESLQHAALLLRRAACDVAASRVN